MKHRGKKENIIIAVYIYKKLICKTKRLFKYLWDI